MKIEGITFKESKDGFCRARSRHLILDLIPSKKSGDKRTSYTAVLVMEIGDNYPSNGSVSATGKSKADAIRNLRVAVSRLGLILEPGKHKKQGWSPLEVSTNETEFGSSVVHTYKYFDDFGCVLSKVTSINVTGSTYKSPWRVWMNDGFLMSEDFLKEKLFKSSNSAKSWVESILNHFTAFRDFFGSKETKEEYSESDD